MFVKCSVTFFQKILKVISLSTVLLFLRGTGLLFGAHRLLIKFTAVTSVYDNSCGLPQLCVDA